MAKFYKQYCPVAKSLDVIGDRWTLLIVRDLLRGKQRFKDLQASLSGIAPNLLSDRLKKLEEAGLIVRQMFRQLPPRVEYDLTDKGRSLETVLQSLAQFGMINLMDKPVRGEILDPEFIFNAMPAVFLPSAARGLKATYRVDISGKQGGTWYVIVSSKRCRVTTEDQPRVPDVWISTDAKTWAMLATGLIEPADAESAGLLEVSGDRDLAERFDGFFDKAVRSVSQIQRKEPEAVPLY